MIEKLPKRRQQRCYKHRATVLEDKAKIIEWINDSATTLFLVQDELYGAEDERVESITVRLEIELKEAKCFKESEGAKADKEEAEHNNEQYRKTGGK